MLFFLMLSAKPHLWLIRTFEDLQWLLDWNCETIKFPRPMPVESFMKYFHKLGPNSGLNLKDNNFVSTGFYG